MNTDGLSINLATVRRSGICAMVEACARHGIRGVDP
jgi:hypothetical protein